MAAGLPVTILPGAVRADHGAGAVRAAERPLPVRRFPAAESAARRGRSRAGELPVTLIFFETTPRLAALLRDLHAVLGDREAAVARELTKLFEEVRRGIWPA